jgi:formamidopyrimidine-DNA glycosylase
MPELPEVETSRRRVEKLFKGKRLVEVIPDPDDRIVYDRASPDAFRKAVEGARVEGTGRKGKYFWLELDRRPWPVFHLGMTGNVEIRKRGRFAKAWGGVKLWSESSRKELDSKILPFCRLRLIADDGSEMAITDPRRFGRIRLAHDPLAEPPVSRLGYDPLISFPNARKLAAILKKRRAPIKAVLLDQGIFAGVGNWIADEVLYQSRLSPHRLAAKLTEKEVARLRTTLLSVIRKSIAVDADYDRYPKTWLFHHRWGKAKAAQTSRHQKIVHDTIGGRTTAWVPSIQI